MSSAPEPLSSFLQPVLGLPAWGVKQGYGSFLTFEFGKPTLEVVEHHSAKRGRHRSAYVHGQWHLWINCCHWRALQQGAELAWSEDAREVIDRAAITLNGQKLTAVNVLPGEGRSSFTFDLGGSLETWPYGDDRSDDQWTVLTGGEAFTYRADGRYVLGPSTTPLNEEAPLSFV